MEIQIGDHDRRIDAARRRQARFLWVLSQEMMFGGVKWVQTTRSG